MTIQRVIHLSKMTGTSGSEGHLLVLLDGLRRAGLDTECWILVEPGNPVAEYVDAATARGIPTRRLTIRRDIDPLLWWRLRRDLRAVRPDAVHTHLIHADLHGITAARAAGVPHVISSRHNDDAFRRKWHYRMIHRWLWQRSSAGIAISDAIRRFTVNVEGAPPDRMHTIHYGLDPARVIAPETARADLCAEIGIPLDAPLVGSVCRLIEQKGLNDGLRGFAQIAEKHPTAHYVFAGDGDQRPALEALAAQLGLAGRVHFLGWRTDAHAILAGLDVLLAPSLWEGFGLVFLEAMALSRPIIASRVSAIPEVVCDGETGWLVPPCDPDAIAAALHAALRAPDERRARGAAGRRRLETDFTPQRMIDRTVALYRNLELAR